MNNDDVPELRGKTPDELRFYRLIESREPDPECAGGEIVTLACGHSSWVAGLPPERRYMVCSTCLSDWVAAEKRLQAEGRVDSTS